MPSRRSVSSSEPRSGIPEAISRSLVDTAIVGWAADRGIASFPGCLTPTEILTAWRAGAAAVKVFPASAVSPALVRELRGPLPEIPLVPTGGVTLENAADFIAAGAAAVGMGSWPTGSGDAAVGRERAAVISRSLADAGNRQLNAKRQMPRSRSTQGRRRAAVTAGPLGSSRCPN